jgi:NAD(P)-dependent dehydrogenase (short-subunit alcohol dehydrogenase family)
MQGDSKQKVATVTGGASGIGLATARAFVSQGYATVLLDRDELAGERARAELGALGECAFLRCDVTDDAAVKQAIDATVARYGRLDAAFNGAGMDGANAPTAEVSMENWQRVLAVNLTATFSCMRYQLPHMVRGGGGSIVNCSSVAGLVGAPNLSAYVAAKHGIVGLTKAAALEYAKAGVRVNAVCPAMIDTPMSREGLSADVRQMLMEQSPIGRFGEAADVASLVLWLCGVGGSNYVTGQAIAIDGGWTTR